MSIPAPYAQTYTQHEPYITSAEYIAAPTGVPINSLVPGGTQAQNMDALEQVIVRASSWADVICDQVLAATVETTSGFFRVGQVAPGVIRVPTDYSPIAAVNSISIGRTYHTAAAVTDLAKAVGLIQRRTVDIMCGAAGLYGGGEAFVSMSYVSGFANSLMRSDVVQGDTSMVLDNVLGIVAGMKLTIFDPGQSEVITVATVDDATSTITLTAGVVHQHLWNSSSGPISVSALPGAVKNAVIGMVSSIIKNRGDQAMILVTTKSTPTQKENLSIAGGPEAVEALGMLRPFVRVY